MREFMDSFGLLVIVGIASFLTGAIMVISSDDRGWAKDCEQVGAHRQGDKVYDCKLRGRAK